MNIRLSEELKLARADRPDEWTMDRFIKIAKNLEAKLDESRQALIGVDCKIYGMISKNRFLSKSAFSDLIRLNGKMSCLRDD